MKKLLITIDGPAGAGKTTVSQSLARALGYRYVDTGALYRGVALAAIGRKVDGEDDDALEALCQSIDLDFEVSENGGRLVCNGEDISEKIRTREVTMMASAVSARPVVRSFLLSLQKRLGSDGAAVFEGRDMGTVVFPGADVKFFLDADLDIRARRRFDQMVPEKGITVDTVREDIAARDQNDASRAAAPLKKAEDAIYIDSSGMTVPEVVDAMVREIRQRFAI